MTIREELEMRERENLSQFASLSENSKGRDKFEEQCDLRPDYQRDRDRILHSKSFRRLKGKTQAFIIPDGDHYRTRMTHTLEVSQIARTISKALRLNEDLTEAIALGHDLGHTPFGHAGERVLNDLVEGGFSHNEQSVRVVEVLEKDGEGLNLTREVRDGILTHRTRFKPTTLEGGSVRLSDKIAYLNHDTDDAIRAKILVEEDIPKALRNILGYTAEQRLDTIIHNVVNTSRYESELKMTPEIDQAFSELRSFMFSKVYGEADKKSKEDRYQQMLVNLFEHYMKYPNELPELQQRMMLSGTAQDRAVCDYIAGMTDQYAILKYREISNDYGKRDVMYDLASVMPMADEIEKDNKGDFGDE